MAFKRGQKDERAKVYKASSTSEAGIMLKEKSVSIIGAKGQHLLVVDETGVTVKGAMSLVAQGPNIRQGGLFINMPDLLSMIPTTIITPFPIRIPYPPIDGLTNMQQDVSFFMGLLSG